MSQYLFEIGLEEIPARFIPTMISEIRARWVAALEKAMVSYGDIQVVGTYRRIATIITDIAAQSSESQQRLRGPIASIALTETGELTPAGNGFLKKNGISDYVIETEGGKEYIVGYLTISSQPTAELLGPMAASVALGISLPIAMTWGSGEGPYIRPIHWIVSVMDDAIVPVAMFGKAAGRMSETHRFLGDGRQVEVKSANDYIETLRSHCVLVDPAERRRIIEEALASRRIEADNDLIDEVVFLTEWPTPLWGTIDADHMELPAAAIVECIQKNQKYFPAIIDGTLTNQYLIVADSVTQANQSIILKGNHSVLRARLEDVKFFWNDDRRASLEDWNKKLDAIVYQKGLGSLGDKVKRIEALSQKMATPFGADVASSTRAARLCKADLVSQMVLELPKLQGIMGGIYAQLAGESEVVSAAIRDLYATDIPTHRPVSAVVAFADRLDTVISCFANGLIPTGSQDPWGVRRAALGVVRYLVRTDSALSIQDVVTLGYECLGKGDSNKEACVAFMLDRIKYVLDADGTIDGIRLSGPVIEAVVSANTPVLQIGAFGKSIQHDLGHPRLKLIAETVIRIQRLGEKGTPNFSESLFQSPEKERLRPVLDWLRADKPIQNLDDFQILTDVMPGYFEETLIMDPDLAVRENRLGLLNRIAAKCSVFADFEKVSAVL